MHQLMLIGGGGHCRACIDVIESSRQFSIAGIVESRNAKKEDVLGYPVIGTDEELSRLIESIPYALVTVGQIKSAKIRASLYHKLSQCGAKFPSITASTAYVSPYAKIANGIIIMHHAVVNSSASIGENSIINSTALIEHDVTIGQHCHISTGAKINGEVVIDDECFVGSGAIIHQSIHIGRESVIAAGAVVRKNIPAGTLYRGDNAQ
jgi:sugar O-acyltransferase (sialic acid O-acetyltransferase NeuD family)